MIGLLGWFRWEVTVISSNFISLQLIITMAIAIHLIVRYRELHRQSPNAENQRLILDTVHLKLKPCLYAALTTIAGFGSLVLCDILPVITFGWMMIAGLVVSLIITFILFPSVLVLLPKERLTLGKRIPFSLTAWLANVTESFGWFIILLSVLGLIFSVWGFSQLKVENCFIDYFKPSTEIYQGMKVIDQQLGGTTPLDIIVEFDKSPIESPVVPEPAVSDEDDIFDEFSEFAEAATDEKYWFTQEKMTLVSRIHSYLEGLPETGKVLSLATALRIAQGLKQDNKPLDSLELALLFNETPERLKQILVYPYASVEHSEVRFSVRIRDSEKTLRRNELLQKIQQDLTDTMGLDADRVHLSGMLVLYNNMLQSLFNSQVLTLGITVGALLGMFLILFRSLSISLIALFPNLLSIGVVLGMMGWLGIPLDMMTITIAAISVGIAVDDTIHYIHRFKQEFVTDGNYLAAMHRSHRSIGHAMYYTSVTIIIGFSILVMSNFIPTIYFGMLTSLAMLIALLCALTLLPQLIILCKPFGTPSRSDPVDKDGNGQQGSTDT
jgi:predicted RND superfamily exporter protein